MISFDQVDHGKVTITSRDLQLIAKECRTIVAVLNYSIEFYKCVMYYSTSQGSLRATCHLQPVREIFEARKTKILQ